MTPHVPRLLLGSLGVLIAATLASWLVTVATLPYGVPVDAVLFLGIAVSVLTTAVGCGVLTRRWPAETGVEYAAGLLGPALLGVVMVSLSAAPLWFRLVTLAAFLGAGLFGLRVGNGGGEPRMRRTRGEVGSGSLEFVGITILAAVLVTAVVAAVASSSPAVRQEIWAAICRVTGGSCEAGEAPVNTDYKPECDVYTQSNKINASVDITFVRLGGGGIVQRVEKSNGDIEITILHEGEAGAVAAIGARGNARFGEHNVALDAEAEAAATLGIQASETYVFQDADEADAFEDYLEGEMAEDAVGTANPIFAAANWAYEGITGQEPPSNDGVQKTYQRLDLSAEASAEVSAGFGSGLGAEVGVMEAIGTEFDRGADHDDPSDDRRTTFIQVDWSAAAHAGVPAVGAADFQHASSGIVKITTDADGNPVQVQFVDKTSGGFQAGLDANQDSTSPAEGNPGGTGWSRAPESGESTWGVAFTGGEDTSTVVTQTLDLDTPERQQAFADWVGAAGGTNLMTTLGTSLAPGVDEQGGVTSFGDGADGFANLMATQSEVSIVEYEGDSWGLGLGLGVAAAAKASFDVNYEDAETRSVEAAYLGAPDADGDRTAYDLPECVA